MAITALPQVDLVVNCFERTYRDVLAPGFFCQVVRDCQFRFAQRTVLLNNIEDMEHALRMAEERISMGEIDRFFLVEDLLPEALRMVGMTRRELGRLAHYSNWAFAALVVPGSDYMVHWDAEIRMVQPFNWIEPSMRLMQADSRIAVANPLWKDGDSAREFRERAGDFSLSYGFCDQVYLMNRREFAHPIYRHWVPIALRYPVAHIGRYFEQMVDSYLRVTGRYRATLMTARYIHPVAEGAAYPRDIKARTLFALKRGAVRAMRSFPGRHRYFHE